MKNIYILLIGFGGITYGWCVPALALPFNPNPSSFQHYANSVGWGGGESVSFSQLYSCKPTKSNAFGTAWAYPNFTPDPRNPYAVEAQKYIDDWYGRKELFPESYTGEDFNAFYATLVKKANEYANAGPKYEHFACSGYVTLTSPKGRRVCNAYVTYSGETKKASYNASGCVWR